MRSYQNNPHNNPIYNLRPCYKCDAKWSVNHKCNKKEVSVLISDEEEEDEIGGNIVEEEPVMGEEMDTIISLNLVVEITNPKTMKMLGSVEKEELIVMIDPGATNNFISNRVVQTLGITCEECKKFGVILGNGDEILDKEYVGE